MKDGPMFAFVINEHTKKKILIYYLRFLLSLASDTLVIVYGATGVEASGSRGPPVKGPPPLAPPPGLGSFFTFVFGATHGCQSQQPIPSRTAAPPSPKHTSVNRRKKLKFFPAGLASPAQSTWRSGGQMINIQSVEAEHGSDMGEQGVWLFFRFVFSFDQSCGRGVCGI